MQPAVAAIQLVKSENRLITKKIVGYTTMNLSFIAVDFPFSIAVSVHSALFSLSLDFIHVCTLGMQDFYFLRLP